MKKIIMATFLLPLVILAGNSDAQESGGQNLFAYATYFECSPDAESRADEIISSSYKPHYDTAVEQGDIQSWSWMQHFVGGNWRRVLVIVTNNMESLLDASGALGEIISDQTPEAGRAFSGICSSHEDYIWQTVAGVGATAVTANRGAAGFTVYMHCDLDREERADELFCRRHWAGIRQARRGRRANVLELDEAIRRRQLPTNTDDGCKRSRDPVVGEGGSACGYERPS